MFESSGTNLLVSRSKKDQEMDSNDCPVTMQEYDSSFNGITHAHDYFEIKYVLSGNVILLIENEMIFLTEGQMVLVEKGCAQEIQGIGGSTKLLGILIEDAVSAIRYISHLGKKENYLVYSYLNTKIFSDKFESNYIIIDLAQNIEVRGLVKSVINELSKVVLNLDLVRSLINVLFYKLSQIYYLSLEEIYKEKKINWTIITVLKKIEEEYESLTLSGLSQEMGYNMNYLSNLIKEKTGKTFKDLVVEIRIKKAYELISRTNLSISQIARRVGYSNKSYFYMKFEEVYGDTPSSFR